MSTIHITCPHCGLGFWWRLSELTILDDLEVMCAYCDKSVFLRASKFPKVDLEANKNTFNKKSES